MAHARTLLACNVGAIRAIRLAPLLWAAAYGAQTQTEDETAVAYALELLDPEAPLVGIHVAVRGDADGTSEFTLSEGWAGITESGKDLELVEARGASEALEHERVNSYTWRVHHAPEEELALVLELVPTSHRASTGPPEYYLPILEPRLLHLLGAQALPAPTHLAGGVARPLTLEWRGFAEAGWKTVSSFGKADLALDLALDAFRHALFLAGDLRLFEQDVHGRPLLLALHGEWRFSDEEFVTLATRIVSMGREFFADFAQPYFLISLIPVGTVPVGKGAGSSYGGTALTDSFALFVTRDVTFQWREGGGGIEWLLAHELFHEWNGQTITLAQPEQEAYWFSEGFTDFYTRRLLFRSGMLDEAEWLASWNQRLANQAANPERHAAAARVREAFWTSRAVGEVPYQRGDLIALFVDHHIRVRSGGTRSLDDLMRALAERGRAGGAPLSNADLFAAIAAEAGAEAGAAVQRWALEGIEPALPADAPGTGYELVALDVPTFDTGFDHEATLRTGVVSGVKPGGCAERAGLRDGMRLSSWSVNHGQTSQPIEVGVRVEGEARKLSFLPHGAPVPGLRIQKKP
jgi:predicted metalloprotease with PDZ domain